MRIHLYDVLGWLAAGMSHAEISDDFPKLTENIRACLELAADRKYCCQVRELIKKDIPGGSERLQQSKVFQVKKPFNPKQWEADMRALKGAAEIPVLPPRAFARESIYGNHN